MSAYENLRIDRLISNVILPWCQIAGNVACVDGTIEELACWRRRLANRNLSTSCKRRNPNRLYIRRKVNWSLLSAPTQWMAGVTRSFEMSEMDANRLCLAWNEKAKESHSPFRYRVMDHSAWAIRRKGICLLQCSAQILKHEKNYVTRDVMKSVTNREIRDKIWSLDVLESVVIECDRRKAYKAAEAQRLRQRDRVRRFRFKAVKGSSETQTTVQRLRDKTLFDVSNWPVGDTREFEGNDKQRWYLLGKLNREFAKGKPKAQIYESVHYTYNTFTLKRVR